MTTLDKVLRGLEVFAAYPEAEIAAEHDVVYAGSPGMVVSSEDETRLRELGWHYDKTLDSWARFV